VAKTKDKGKRFCDLVLEGKDVRAALDELGMSHKEAAELVDFAGLLLDKDQVEKHQDGGLTIKGSQLDRIEVRVEGLRREIQEMNFDLIQLRGAIADLIAMQRKNPTYGKGQVLTFPGGPKAG
jgi:hypothetical protein